MKRKHGKEKGLSKGMPSAVLLSILIHAGLFILAGMLVVFTVVKKSDQQFEPPRAVERPKMKLKKPKVKVKKASRPKTTRIATRSSRSTMPNIELPDMGGLGSDFGGPPGGFDMMPDMLEDVTVFGSGQSIGSDFEGTFYDFNRDRADRNIPMNPSTFRQKIVEFVKDDWNTTRLTKYYRSPNKLYATTFMIPPMLSAQAPFAFGEGDTGGYCWMVHYTGKLVHKEGITFRFWGNGDDLLLVRVDGEEVLSACWDGTWGAWSNTEAWFSNFFQPSSADNRQFWLGNNYAVVGDWITLEPGVPVDMEVIFGEVPGGQFCAMLVVEEKGVEYEKNRQGGPILPIFKTAELSHDQVDVIFRELVEGEASVTNGPVFCDYDTVKPDYSSHRIDAVAGRADEAPVEEETMRTWTVEGLEPFDAEFIAVIGKNVVLRNTAGREEKIPAERFSGEDRTYIELCQPPEFRIDFSKKSTHIISKESEFNEASVLPQKYEYIFSTRLRQVSAGNYDHELHVEYFAIGKEYFGERYVLLDRQESRFVPTKENDRLHSFSGNRVELITYPIFDDIRGTKYDTYLVVVTDSRGKIIQYQTPNEWLFEYLDNLKQIPVGRYMDKTCLRTFPTRPTTTLY